MTSLLPTGCEQKFIADSINEALELYGQNVTLFPRAVYSKYLDNVTLSEGISLKILMQTHPQRKLLNNLGWYKEDKNDQQIILFAPFKINGNLLSLKEGDVFLFEDRMCLEIKAVNRSYLYGLWNVVNTVPYEKDNPVLADEYNKHAKTSEGETIEKTHLTSPWQTMSDDEFLSR